MNLTNFREVGSSGTANKGFQFEFRCAACARVWKSKLRPYKRGQLSWLVSRAAYYVDSRGRLSRIVSGMLDSGVDRARQSALEDAVSEAAERYSECEECAKVVCTECFVGERNLCEGCAGQDARGSSASRSGSRSGARSAAAQSERPSVAAAPSCPNCQCSMDGGRFCPECGFDMASTHKSCPSCGAMCVRASRFCTDCGHAF